MSPVTGHFPREELIFRQRITLVPGVLAEVLARLSMLIARNCPRRQVRDRGLGGAGECCERRIVTAEPPGVHQPTDELVVGIGRKAVVAVEASARVDRRGVTPH